MLASGGQGGDGAEIVEAVSEFDDKNTNILASGQKEFEQVVFSRWQVGGKVAHIFAGFAKFGDAFDEKSDIFTEGGFDFGEGKKSVFDGVVKDASNDGIFVHAPVFEDFLNGNGMHNVRFPRKTSLALMGLCSGGDCSINASHKLIVSRSRDSCP